MTEFNFDNEQEDQMNVLELVEQYEQASKSGYLSYFDEEAYETIIEYYENKGQFEYALDVSVKSLIQYPYSSILLLKKAQVHFELKQIQLSLEILEKAELYDSSEVGIYTLRAEIFAFQSQYAEAVTLLKKIIKTADKEDLPDIYLQLCDVYEEWEKYDEVYECLILCLKIDGLNEEALNRLNYCVEITNKNEQTIPFFKQLIDQHPYSEFAWYGLACCYARADKYEQAVNAYEYVSAINEDADFVYQDIAELHYKQGEYRKALDVIKDMCDIFEADDEIYFLQGKCHEALGDMKMARYCYRKAVHSNPSFSEAHFRIGETYKQEGLWEQAFKSFQKANDLEKEQYEFCIAMAEAAMEMAEADVVINACETAIDISMNRYEAYFLLAKIISIGGDTDTALQILIKGTDVCKATIPLNYAICAIAFMENKPKQGEVLLRMLLNEDYDTHYKLFEFCEPLEDDIFVLQIIAEYN